MASSLAQRKASRKWQQKNPEKLWAIRRTYAIKMGWTNSKYVTQQYSPEVATTNEPLPDPVQQALGTWGQLLSSGGKVDD